MADPLVDDLVKSITWAQDASYRLYYGLWIMFLGGFVISLRVPAGARCGAVFCLLLLFRLISLAGTALNFVMQFDAINSIGRMQTASFLIQQGKDAASHQAAALRSRRIAKGCETPLLLIGTAFLSIAFVLSVLTTSLP